MKIKFAEALEGLKNRLIIGNEPEKFAAYLKEEANQAYLLGRNKNEKKVTLVNENQQLCIFITLINESNSAYNDNEYARRQAHAVFSIIEDHDMEEIALINAGLDSEIFKAFTEGLALTNYHFTRYFTDGRKRFSISEVQLIDSGLSLKELTWLDAVIDGNAFCRDLVNEPLSYLTAEKLAEEIEAKGKETGYTVEVFNKKKIESLRMGGLLAVNKGSIDPPTFSILEWKPENPVNERPLILVGKGIVYDTGGLSLKPTHNSMDYMKCDMGGAAAVAGTFAAIAKAGLPVHVIGLVPATDNRPDGNAYVPGDVIEMYNGSTVEVLNTDAEGRMILADALSYAKQYDPELVIELSTLTGSAHAAVGNYAIVGMGNAGEEVMKSLKESGMRTHERIAEFPFWDDYAELLTSDIADMKNIGGKYAGAITAGKFLEKFTDYPFIHLDIAGPSFNKTKDNYRGTGGSGVGVRLLFDFLSGKTK